MLVHFENKYGREKKHWKTTIIDRYTKYTLLLADSSTTSITDKLVMLLIKRRKFLVKLSEIILYKTDVCFKRKKYRREIWVLWSEHSRKCKIYFVFCVTEHLRHMACSVIPSKHINVESTLKQRWLSTFIDVVSTLIFGWKWNLSRRTFFDVVSTLRKHRG